MTRRPPGTRDMAPSTSYVRAHRHTMCEGESVPIQCARVKEPCRLRSPAAFVRPGNIRQQAHVSLQAWTTGRIR